MAPHDSFEADRPIKQSEEDRLGRRTFAEHAAKILVRSASEEPIVVGLYGPWGSGKTSILNLITAELEKTKDASVVYFNPWYFTGEAQLLERFFEEIAATLGSKAMPARQEAANALRKYLGYLKPAIKVASYAADAVLPGTGVAARVITEVATPAVEKLVDTIDPVADALKREVSLDDARKAVSEKLLKASVRIVVLIDDIDRLYPDDIRMVFKLVRLVGDLPRVSYLLAFDPDVVAASLVQTSNGESNVLKGHAYLEKIIQVALPLPKARRQDLRKTALTGIAEIATKHELAIPQKELQRLVNGWGLGIEQSAKTIRQVKRILNAINFSIGLLKNEVNVVDLMLFEALRIVHPGVVDAITAEPQRVLKKVEPEDRKKSQQGALELELSKLPTNEQHEVINLLQVLFPHLDTHCSYSESFDVQWRQEKRIASEEHLEKALGYGVPSGIISDALYNEMLLALRSTIDTSKYATTLDQIVRTNSWEDLIWRLRQDRESLPDSAAYQLATTIAQRSSEFPRDDGFMGTQTTTGNAALLVTEILRNIKDQTESKNSAIRLIKASSSIYFAALVLRWMETVAENTNTTPHTNAPLDWIDTLRAAKSAYRERMSLEFDISQAIDQLNRDELLAILYHWGESAGREAVESALREWLAKDNSGAKRLITAIIPPIAEDNFWTPIRRIGVSNSYSVLKSIISPTVLARALGYDAGSPLSPETIKNASTLPHQEQAILLFLEIYQNDKTQS
jgi:hypothetical protein